MTDYGLVSIITPTYNSAAFVAETIEAIIAQTYSNWELLITDDCSTDSTIDIVQKYCEIDSRIKLFKLEKNSGAGVARNNSIREAKGRFIAFCDADDRWYPEKLEKQLCLMTEEDIALSYTSYDTSNEEGEIIGRVNCLKSLNYLKILRDNGIGCLTAMYDTEKIGKCYFPSIRKRQDWCLWIDIIKKFGPAYGLQTPLSIYRIRKGSISSNKFAMLKYNYNVYRQVLQFNRLTSFMLLVGYFLPYYLYKKIKQRIEYKRL